jgi:hypothetical protein
MRSVGRVFTWLNAENDMARVTKVMREMDLDFTLPGFGRELREYIIPEVTEGWVEADGEMLKPWLGEAVSDSPTFYGEADCTGLQCCHSGVWRVQEEAFGPIVANHRNIRS